MKKALYATIIIVGVLAVSCNKELDNPSDGNNQEIVLKAIVNDDLTTKTDYDIPNSESTTATFSWLEGDCFARLVKNNSSYSTTVYTAISVDGKEGIFRGEEPTGVQLHAVYPVNAGNGADINVESGNELRLNLPSSITYNHDHPLRNIVPMLGKKEGDAFTFYPLTGVIGFTATNIPSTATSIILSTTGSADGLSGRSVNLTTGGDTGINNLGLTTHGIKRDWMESNTPIALNFSANTFSTGTFYFPVPPSLTNDSGSFPYTNFTITLKAGSETLADVSISGISLSILKGQIWMLPSIDFARLDMGITGDVTEFSAFIKTKSDIITNVKVAVAASAADAITAARSSSTTIESKGIENAVTISSGLSASGKYYMGYIGYDSSGNEVTSGSALVYYITNSDKNLVVSQYRRSASASYTKTPSSNPSTLLNDDNYNTITIELSDNISKGNIMITEFAGLHFNPTTATNTATTAITSTWTSEYQSANFADGSPLYGNLGGLTLNNTTRAANFEDLNTHTFFKDTKANRNYFIAQYDNVYSSVNNLRLAFDSTGYTNDGRHGLVVWDPGIRLSHSTTYSSYMLEFMYFVADKVTTE